jgi:hypothetical protein
LIKKAKNLNSIFSNKIQRRELEQKNIFTGAEVVVVVVTVVVVTVLNVVTPATVVVVLPAAAAVVEAATVVVVTVAWRFLRPAGAAVVVVESAFNASSFRPSTTVPA